MFGAHKIDQQGACSECRETNCCQESKCRGILTADDSSFGLSVWKATLGSCVFAGPISFMMKSQPGVCFHEDVEPLERVASVTLLFCSKSSRAANICWLKREQELRTTFEVGQGNCRISLAKHHSSLWQVDKQKVNKQHLMFM